MSYLKIKDYDRANIYTNAALMEDPDYSKAAFRKCEILEEMCEYAQARIMAQWGFDKFKEDKDDENKRNAKFMLEAI